MYTVRLNLSNGIVTVSVYNDHGELIAPDNIIGSQYNISALITDEMIEEISNRIVQCSYKCQDMPGTFHNNIKYIIKNYLKHKDIQVYNQLEEYNFTKYAADKYVKESKCPYCEIDMHDDENDKTYIRLLSHERCDGGDDAYMSDYKCYNCNKKFRVFYTVDGVEKHPEDYI